MVHVKMTLVAVDSITFVGDDSGTTVDGSETFKIAGGTERNSSN